MFRKVYSIKVLNLFCDSESSLTKITISSELGGRRVINTKNWNVRSFYVFSLKVIKNVFDFVAFVLHHFSRCVNIRQGKMMENNETIKMYETFKNKNCENRYSKFFKQFHVIRCTFRNFDSFDFGSLPEKQANFQKILQINDRLDPIIPIFGGVG